MNMVLWQTELQPSEYAVQIILQRNYGRAQICALTAALCMTPQEYVEITVSAWLCSYVGGGYKDHGGGALQ